LGFASSSAAALAAGFRAACFLAAGLIGIGSAAVPVGFFGVALTPDAAGLSSDRFSAAMRSTTFDPRAAGASSSSEVLIVLPFFLRSIRSRSAST
jgi:hypothetical protein